MAFTGKVVLITGKEKKNFWKTISLKNVYLGASSGIGAETATKLAAQGARLVLSGRNVQSLNLVAENCGTSNAFVVPGDVTKESDNENLISETIKKYNRLDVLINNAGILESGTIETTSLEQFDRVMSTNIRSIYNLTMLAVPHLIKTQGNIVNISSVNGIRSFPGVLAYNISKAAVDQFTRCVALELALKNVRVNSVNPGVTVTNLVCNSVIYFFAYK